MILHNTLWFEKYRPQKISDCILTSKQKKIFSGYIKNKDVPNLMFTGSQGTGKTTVAKVIAKELDAELLYIDCSTDSGKSMIQEMIVPYASTVSVVNSNVPKFILCDECLEENETVRIGTIDNYKDIPLKDLETNTMYPVVSMNMKTKELENDTAYLCTDKEDELFEVFLSNGKKIICNKNHPFVIEQEDGTLTKVRLKEGLEGLVCLVE